MRHDGRMAAPSTTPSPTGNDALFPGKVFISTVLGALETKTRMTGGARKVYLQRASMAGIIIGVFYSTYYSIAALFAGMDAGGLSMAPIGKLVGSLAFGWALVFIYFTRSELLTSNMMVVTVGAYHHRIKLLRASWLLVLCFVGNFFGGLLVAVMLRFSTLTNGLVGEQMLHSVETKLAYVSAGPAGWVDLLIRAIFCNLMINLAMILIYNGFIHDDLTKSLGMIAAVFVFAFLGLEHSVANTVLFTIVGVDQGIDVGLAMGNVGIALIGNYLGGGLLVGWFYAYANDETKHAGIPRRF